MLKKIYPFDAGSTFDNSFKIIFISEGYLAADRADFISSCIDFTDKLLESPPFNLTRINSNWLSVYASFTPSKNSGPSVNTIPAAGRTAFESKVDTATGLIAVNQLKLNAYLDAETVFYNKTVTTLNKLCQKGVPNYGLGGSLFVLLTPAVAAKPNGFEYEHTPSATDYYFVATTTDNLWHQLVIRAMCKVLWLGDEFELNGSDFLSPDLSDVNIKIGLPFNLELLQTPPVFNGDRSKWKKLFSTTQRGVTAVKHLKPPAPAKADNTISNDEVSFKDIEFWEGGYGYRTKVYRTAKDCLMRRKIGEPLLPTRKKMVAFCPACMQYLKNILS
jgi:hypothetical protein